jgi:hypothetical protein
MPRFFTTLRSLLSGISQLLRGPRAEAPAPPPAAPREAANQTARLPRKPPYDLAKDTSTDHQKYLM